MNEDQPQDPMQAQEQHPEMSDDETASALGFITTLSEHLQNSGQEDDEQETDPSEDSKPDKQQPEGKTDSIDDEQQTEIDDIRRELEELKNGNQPEPTPVENTVPTPQA